MGLQTIQTNLKFLGKDEKKARELLKKEEWDSLLFLVDAAVDDANIDVVLASEEDNGQLIRSTSETLEQLMKLKFAIEDYIEENVEDDYEEFV